MVFGLSRSAKTDMLAPGILSEFNYQNNNNNNSTRS